MPVTGATTTAPASAAGRRTTRGGLRVKLLAAPVVAIPAVQCNAQCSLPVDVTIDWPDGAGHGSTSVAWELVVTTDAAPNTYVYTISNAAGGN